MTIHKEKQTTLSELCVTRHDIKHYNAPWSRKLKYRCYCYFDNISLLLFWWPLTANIFNKVRYKSKIMPFTESLFCKKLVIYIFRFGWVLSHNVELQDVLLLLNILDGFREITLEVHFSKLHIRNIIYYKIYLIHCKNITIVKNMMLKVKKYI